MDKPVQDSPETIRCVICLCSPPTMLSLDTPIDVEGTQMCCGAMYGKFIWLEESAVANIRQDWLKLCLSCLTQLSSCYLFQRQAIKSAELLSSINHRSWNESIALEGSIGMKKCDETNEEFIEECINVDHDEDVFKGESNLYQNSYDIAMESLDRSATVMEDGMENIICETDNESLEELSKEAISTEEYIYEPDEIVKPDEVTDEAATACFGINLENMNQHELEDHADEMVILNSGAEDTDAECQRNTEQDETGTLIMVRGAEDGSVQCARCALGMDTMASFREHFVKDHCLKESATQMYCTECKRNFKGRKPFIQHLATHQANKQYVCRLCSKSFHYPHHLRKHELTHSTDRPFRCEKCPKTFTSVHNLESHQTQHETQAKYVCNVCQMRFKSLKVLHKHQLIKHDAPVRYFEPYACEKCGKMLHSLTAATYHARLQCRRPALGPASWYINCSVCKQQFSTRTKLERHLKAKHTAEEHQSYIRQNSSKSSANECDVCGRKFSQRVILMRHKLRHEGKKPYQCEHCQRTFAQQGTLKTHLRTHTNERPFLCPGCGDSFRSAGSLRSHRLRRCGKHVLSPNEMNKSDA